jgi:hypothetical protein
LSSLERVRLETEEGKSINVILKTLPVDPGIRKYTVSTGFASREVQMYTKVFKDFEKFLISRNVSREKYLFRHPKCYFGKEEGEGETYSMILILEDLLASNYETWAEGPGKDLEWTHAAATIREVALLHAVSVAYARVNNVKSFMDIYPFLMDNTAIDDNLGGYIKAGLEATYRLLNEDKETLPAGIMERLDHMGEILPGLIRKRAVENTWACIRHHDLHTGNIFFSKKGNSVTAALIDFQVSMLKLL